MFGCSVTVADLIYFLSFEYCVGICGAMEIVAFPGMYPLCSSGVA